LCSAFDGNKRETCIIEVHLTSKPKARCTL
jgi:hypothetical protein